MKSFIRKATLNDRPGLHLAHMRSIREVCIKDHGPDEVKGWGNRELGERWISGINAGLVWVVEHNSEIHGVGSIAFSEDNSSAHIQSLYLTPEVLGMGFGKQLMNVLLQTAKNQNVKSIQLDSTITAHNFYKKFGFKDTGPANKSPIGGSPVTGFPMSLTLTP